VEASRRAGLCAVGSRFPLGGLALLLAGSRTRDGLDGPPLRPITRPHGFWLAEGGSGRDDFGVLVGMLCAALCGGRRAPSFLSVLFRFLPIGFFFF